jgi:large subunit ribosomal protein L29
MKTAEIRKLGVEEIRAKLAETREDLMKMRFRHVTGQLTDFTKIRSLRRDIARMETILHETETAGAVEGEA